jgi:hypothetical protein
MRDFAIHGWPICAVCQKKVERLEWVTNPADSFGVTIRAFCHGAKEDSRISMLDMMSADRVEMTTAFNQPTLQVNNGPSREQG